MSLYWLQNRDYKVALKFKGIELNQNETTLNQSIENQATARPDIQQATGRAGG